MAGFVAAVDVWHDRGCGRIERWQQAAFQRLLSKTAAARVQALEPDITLAWRITAALAQDAPGENGWAAYALAARNRLDEFDKLTRAQREAARVLTRDRLTALEAAVTAAAAVAADGQRGCATPAVQAAQYASSRCCPPTGPAVVHVAGCVLGSAHLARMVRPTVDW